MFHLLKCSNFLGYSNFIGDKIMGIPTQSIDDIKLRRRWGKGALNHYEGSRSTPYLIFLLNLFINTFISSGISLLASIRI